MYIFPIFLFEACDVSEQYFKTQASIFLIISFFNEQFSFLLVFLFLILGKRQGERKGGARLLCPGKDLAPYTKKARALCNYEFVEYVPTYSSPQNQNADLIVAQIPLNKLSQFVPKKSFVNIVRQHNITGFDRNKDSEIAKAIANHHCNLCDTATVVFAISPEAKPGRARMSELRAKQTQPRIAIDKENNGLNALSSHWLSVISGFCSDTSQAAFQEKACAVCAQLTPVSELKELESVKSKLHLLVSNSPDVGLQTEFPLLVESCESACKSCTLELLKNKVPKDCLGQWSMAG